MDLVLYSKSDCHLCEGLLEKLQQMHPLDIEVEVRDITLCEEWFQAYQYEVPVLYVKRRNGTLERLPRLSPRASLAQVQQLLQNYLGTDP
jgi:hypothetical protein